MIHPTNARGVIASAEPTAQPGDAIREFDATLRGLGVTRYAYFRLRHDHAGPEILTSLPSAWLAEYAQAALHRVDPVLQRARRRALPFAWSTPRAHALDDARLRDNALAHGIHRGRTYVSLSHAGGIGILTLCDAPPSATGAVPADATAQFALLTFHAHHAEPGPTPAADSKACAPASAEAIARLSLREREVVRWIARGKTYAETATILGIAERTIKFHMANVRAKLDVTSSRQVVSWAASHGLT
ncbi:helix-turn-helix transcriptional regulator [Salinicola halophilus]|uniref:helix-turn-helix transcriptional regulator n=1 Tax=Salinicola halophilus TaxID=184065 RepID=UPI000DA2621D|nr:LuxR family transcriptional regulator [Salinicola halophilus]